MTEKGCENCYYKYFDARAYPCSLCIRGIERQDRWMPKIREMNLKEIRDYQDYYKLKNEPQTSGVVWTEDAIKNELKSYTTWTNTDKPQMNYCETCKHNSESWDFEACDSCSRANSNYEPKAERPCDTCANKDKHNGECRNCVADSEPIRWKTPSHYKPKTEPQTGYTPDCPFCKMYGTEDCLGSDCRHYKTYKDEPQTDIGTSDTVYNDTTGYVPRVDMIDCL